MTLNTKIMFCRVLFMASLIITLAQTHPDTIDFCGSEKMEKDTNLSSNSLSHCFSFEKDDGFGLLVLVLKRTEF